MWNARRAYERRRGWLAWHIAALVRTDEMPDLEELTGDEFRDTGHSHEQMAHNLRLWKAAMAAGKPH